MDFETFAAPEKSRVRDPWKTWR